MSTHAAGAESKCGASTPRPERLMTPIAVRAGLVAALTAVVAVSATVGVLAVAAMAGHDAGHGERGLWNDFYSYWGAGRVLNQGGNPYDQGALRAAYRAAGISPEVGSGYSYPLGFAELMRPLALLPPHAAAALFCLLSAGALAFGLALLLGAAPRLGPRAAIGVGVLTGLAPPIAGSLYVGQVNLLLLPPLALAYRRVAPGPMLAVAGAVKLFPAVGLAALVLGGRHDRREAARGLALLGAMLVVPSLLVPQAAYSGRLGELIAPDPYWTNVSVNGSVSRLAVPFDGITPPLLGLPVSGVVTALCLLLGLAVGLALRRSRARPWGLSLGLALALGVMVAPKNSIWNSVPLLVCLPALWEPARNRPALRRALAGGLGLLLVGSVGVLVTLVPGPPLPLRLWIASMALFGTVLIGGCALLALVGGSPGTAPGEHSEG